MAAPPRDSLLASALDLLASRGPRALRVREVAKAAGTSTMGVYTHFGSKQALVQSIYDHGFAALARQLGAAATTGDPYRDVLALARAYRAFALEEEALYGVMFERAVEDFVPSPESRRASLASYAALVERIVAWRSCPLGEAEHIGFLVFGAVHGLVSLELTHRRWGGPIMEHLDADGSATFDAALDRLLAGL